MGVSKATNISNMSTILRPDLVQVSNTVGDKYNGSDRLLVIFPPYVSTIKKKSIHRCAI